MDANLARAEQLIDLRRYVDAERVLRQALSDDPMSTEAMRMLAETLMELKRKDEAVSVGRAAAAMAPDDPDVLATLASVLVERGGENRIDEARRAAQRATQIAPHDWYGYLVFALALNSGRRPRTRDALTVSEGAVTLAPHSAAVHNLRGVLFSDLMMFDEARAAYQEALRLDPGHAGAINNLGQLDRGLFGGRSARAIRQAVEIAPSEQVFRDNVNVATSSLAFNVVGVASLAQLVLGGCIRGGSSLPARLVIGGLLLGAMIWLASWGRRQLPRGLGATWGRVFSTADGGTRVVVVLAALGFLIVALLTLLPPSAARTVTFDGVAPLCGGVIFFWGGVIARVTAAR